MKYLASIDIMPLKELLDPQGKTVEKNLKNLEIDGLSNIRIGKHIDLMVEADNEEKAGVLVDSACKKMFANVIMESFVFELSEVK